MSELNKPAINNIDVLAADLSIREHAAITLRVPMSGDPELDAMISEARRLDAAEMAMQGFLSSPIFNPMCSPEDIVKDTISVADALLAAIAKAENGALKRACRPS